MNISDRDRKIIYGLLILLVTILPYTFYIKNQRVETESLRAGNVELQARYDYLSQLDAQRDLYEEATQKYYEMRDEIIAKYPANILPENFTMFLLETEYDSYTEIPRGDYANFFLNEYTYVFNAITYVENVETPISSESTDTGYVGLTNVSVVNYSCLNYESFKYLIKYLYDYPEPLMYTSITMKFDEKTGNILGDMTISQYAIAGTDRELEAVEIWPDLDVNDLRGNEVIGVFGPKIITLEDLEEMNQQVDNLGLDGEAPVEPEEDN